MVSIPSVASDHNAVNLSSSELCNTRLNHEVTNLISVNFLSIAENDFSYKALSCNSTSALCLNSDLKITGSRSELDTRAISKQNFLHHIAVLNSHNQQKNSLGKR